MYLWDSNNWQQHNACLWDSIDWHNDPNIRLNHTVFCHVHRDSIQVLPNIWHRASIHLKISLAKSWQWNLYNYIDTTKHSGSQKILCPSMSKSWGGHVHLSVLTLGLCIAEYLSSFSLWTLKSTRRQGDYHQIHEARIQVCGSPCSRGF